MKKTSFTKVISVILCIVLIAAMALVTSGCNNDEVNSIVTEKSFTLTVCDLDGNATDFDVTTDKTTVGEALLKEGLIEGTDGQYGLYITTVNGIIADDSNNQYWAFYINGEYAMTGVDTTEIVQGADYALKLEKY